MGHLLDYNAASVTFKKERGIMSRRPARTTQADIARALRAAEKIGLKVSVEIIPDGTIRIIPQNNLEMLKSKDEPRPIL